MIRWNVLLAGALLALGASSGCGITEGEQADLALETTSACPDPEASVSPLEASRHAELIVLARPADSYFVDNCHRAFVLDIDSVWKGSAPEVVLAIVQVDPLSFGETWNELRGAETAVLLLERHPEVPEAFRPVAGNRGVIDVAGDLALPCDLPGICQPGPLELDDLRGALGL